MQRERTARKDLWRRRLFAAGLVAALHLAFFAVIVSDWARHLRPARQDTVLLTLDRAVRERPEAPSPPPRAHRDPQPPPPPQDAPSVSETPAAPLSARAPAQTDGVTPLVVGSGGVTDGTRSGGALDLGCMTPNLPRRQREACDKQRLVASLERPDPVLKGIGPRKPPDPNAPKPREPGWHFGLPFGVSYVYGPNDKHFLPGFGDTKTTVVEPEEIDFLPIPMK